MRKKSTGRDKVSTRPSGLSVTSVLQPEVQRKMRHEVATPTAIICTKKFQIDMEIKKESNEVSRTSYTPTEGRQGSLQAQRLNNSKQIQRLVK